MTAKKKHLILTLSLFAGAVWNLLCLFPILPINLWPLSVTVVCIGNLFILVPQMKYALAHRNDPPQKQSKRQQKKNPPKKPEPLFDGNAKIAAFAYCVTLVVCILFPA